MLDHYLKQFESDSKQSQISWIAEIRKKAMDRFLELGFPTTKLEEWKYTSLIPLTQISFERVSAYRPNGLKIHNLPEIVPLEAIRFVFVNGHFAPELSFVSGLPKGVILASLEETLQKNPDRVEPYLTRYASSKSKPFVALNTAFLKDGAFIFIPQGTILKEPIHLLFLSKPSEQPTLSHPRNLIVAEAGSECSIIEHYDGFDTQTYFTNAVTEIVAETGAIVNHYKVQNEQENAFHMASLATHQGAQSQFNSYSISLGAGLARNDLNTVLAAVGGECTLNGLYLARGKQHVDNYTNIDHAEPHCTSAELYKGILDDQAQGVFNGRIYVRAHAEKTSARQTNKNLLLSNDAAINTKPLLEILNNDVKCNHGATIGRLDENQLFYLRSRGVGEDWAKSLLTYAFASDVISPIRLPSLKTGLQEILFARLMKCRLPQGGLHGLEGFHHLGGKA